MAVDRLLPTEEAVELLALVREIAQDTLAPQAAAAEAAAEFPRELFRTLGGAGLLSLPYSERFGGADQPYEVYLQVLEELAAHWMTVALGVSVHVMASYPMAECAEPSQRDTFLPAMLAGQWLGAYALSEPQAGSDIFGMAARAQRVVGGYELDGQKAWISHSGQADFYTVFVRTSNEPRGGLSCFHVLADAPGLGFGAPEHKMGMAASPTGALFLDGVAVDSSQLIGPEGQGARIALSALDRGRLGIAACATGLAQSALDVAVDWARQRRQFGRPIAEFQGLRFLLAEMAAAVASARATYLYAARRLDAARPFTRDAAVAKMVATDAAMRVTTDAVQVLGGYGYTQDFPAERFLREAKVTQIFEGTNQIQRMVIARELLKELS